MSNQDVTGSSSTVSNTPWDRPKNMPQSRVAGRPKADLLFWTLVLW